MTGRTHREREQEKKGKKSIKERWEMRRWRKRHKIRGDEGWRLKRWGDRRRRGRGKQMEWRRLDREKRKSGEGNKSWGGGRGRRGKKVTPLLLSGGFNLSSETMRGGCQSSTDQVISCHQHTKHGCEPAAPLRTESHPHSLCNGMFEEASRSSSPAAFVRTPSSRGDLTSRSPSGRSGLWCFCLPTILRSPLRLRPHLHILSSLLASHCPLFTSLWMCLASSSSQAEGEFEQENAGEKKRRRCCCSLIVRVCLDPLGLNILRLWNVTNYTSFCSIKY